MVMRNIIGKSGEEKVVDLVKDLQRRVDAANTTPAGDKVLEEGEDFYWSRPDGTEPSMREVDLELEDARVRISEAEEALIQTGERLEDAEEAVAGVREDLDNIDFSGGGGSSSIVKDRPPLLEDGAALPVGAAWLHYDSTGALVGMYRWDGEAWETMPLDRELIPAVDIGTGTFGDLEGERLTVNDTLSARVVQAMSGEMKKLVVTEEAILNHATLIGQTVVDDINVQGKLIGTDGVFTGTVDFANINVTGDLLADKIKGKTIEGVELIGSSVEAADDDFRIFIGPDAVKYRGGGDGGTYYAAGLAISSPRMGGATVSLEAVDYGAADGVKAAGLVARDASGYKLGGEVYVADGGISGLNGSDGASVTASGANVGLVHGSSNATRSYLYVSGQAANSSIKGETPGTVTLHGGYGKNGYSLDIGPRGLDVWARGANGAYDGHLVDLLKANSTTASFPLSNLWYMGDSPTPIIITPLPYGRLCQARARIQNNHATTSLPRQKWVTINLGPIPAGLRKGATDYIEVRMPQGDSRGLVEMAYSINRVRIKSLDIDIDWRVGASIWFDMQWYVPDD